MLPAIILTLCGSFLNALSSVLQRREASDFEASDLLTKHLVGTLLKNKLWLAGMAIQIGAFFFQAAALKFGILSVVEPITTTDLLFMLAILYFYMRVPFGRREWLGALAISAGLSGLLLAAHPHGGQLSFSLRGWLITAGSIAFVAAAAALYGRKLPNPVARAAFMGLAAGASFALTAALTKLFVNKFAAAGAGVLLSYEPYTLLVSGIASLFLAQNTYGAGPLAASQPAMMISDPVVSIVIGVFLFNDLLNHSLGALVAEVISGAVLALGVVLLTGSPVVRNMEQLK